MKHPVPDPDVIRLIAALVYVQGGQVTLTERQRREAPSSYSVQEDLVTGELVLIAPALEIEQEEGQDHGTTD